MQLMYDVSNVALTFAYLLPMYHRVQYPPPPQGSALALWHFFPLPLLPPVPKPNVDLFIYPWVTSNILFICSFQVCWDGNKPALCSDFNQRQREGPRCLSLTVDCPMNPGCIGDCCLQHIKKNNKVEVPPTRFATPGPCFMWATKDWRHVMCLYIP